MKPPVTIPLAYHPSFSDAEMLQRAELFYQQMNQRRTVRHFSNRPVDQAVIEAAIRSAGTSPSGANLQPWHFVAISNRDIKRTIRLAAEEEEREFYAHRAPPEWLAALEPLGTDSNKPFLEDAPWLIACMVQPYGFKEDGSQLKHYYAVESTGIAVGMLITCLHQAGLATLTHTPSPMKFLNAILNRPAFERPFLLLVVGHPVLDAQVPDIHRKSLNQIATILK
ncbi:MAG: nitroreductase family protein [Planctomycetia bacterium]|nr:nitroreductase family protein [Planctomycetia bacterium]